MPTGVYGLCEGTGKPIAKARLEAAAVGTFQHRIRPPDGNAAIGLATEPVHGYQRH